VPKDRRGDEHNLLYVAITRARKRLLMSRQLYDVLSQHGHRFFRLVPTRDLCKAGTAAPTCCVLDRTIEPQTTVTLCCRRITLVSNMYAARGTGITRADERHGNPFPRLVVKDKVGRPQVSLGCTSLWNVIFSLQCSDTVGWATGRASGL